MATIPSISLIPTGYIANKVYSVLPTDGAADLTFARTNSATRVNSNNLIEEVATGVPRLDYTDGTCPSLLLEPQSTNLLTYPLSFDNAAWTLTDATVSGSESAPSVDNPTSAYLLTATSNNGEIQVTVSGSNTTTYTTSFYIKRKTGTGVVNIRSVENVNTPITVTDEWTRVSFAAESTSTTIRAGIRLATSGDAVYIFGAQLEQQSYATSLMLPATEGSTVTRVAETASKTGLESYINNEVGVLYAELSALTQNTGGVYFSISDGTTSNRVYVGFGNSTVSCRYKNASDDFTINEAVNILNINKIAAYYGNGIFKVFLNGVQIGGTKTLTDVLSGINRIGGDSGSGSFNNFYGKCKDLRVYKTALTDAELTTLTT